MQYYTVENYLNLYALYSILGTLTLRSVVSISKTCKNLNMHMLTKLTNKWNT